MQFRARIVTWTDIENWCDSIRHKVMEDYAPDTLIGIARGGLVPARILSDRMWIKDLLSVKTEHWGITATRDGEATLKGGLNGSLDGKKVLVVDDITDTGESLRIASEHVKSLKPVSMKTATMLHITRSGFVPDYYAEEINEKSWTWFIFPWNVYEDLDNLIGRSLVKPMNTDEIRTTLETDYQLNTGEVDLQEIMNEFEKAGKVTLSNGKWEKRN